MLRFNSLSNKWRELHNILDGVVYHAVAFANVIKNLLHM